MVVPADWSIKNDYKHGGLKNAPKPGPAIKSAEEMLAEAQDGDMLPPTQEIPKPGYPLRVKRAWEYYAEDKFKQVC